MKYFLLTIFSFIGANMQAQTGKIKGTIKTADEQPASFVNVFLKETGKGAVADTNGHFEIKNIQPGSYTLSITFIGYNPEELHVEVTPGETTMVADIKLAETSKQLDEIMVTATRGYKEDFLSSSLRLKTPILEMPQNIQVVTGQLIKEQQTFDMLEGVTRNVSGTTRSEHWDNYANITMRGTQIGSFRNGMNVQMPWGPLVEDMSMVERIEFVKGPAGFMLANGEPTGFYNVVTKKPTGINKGEATITLGSFDTYRATLDLDGKLSSDGKLLFRVNMMGQLKGSHRDYDFNNRYTIVPVIMYKIDDKTSLTAEYTLQFSRMALIGSAYVFSPKGYGDLPRNATLAEPNLDPSDMHDQSIFLTLNRQLDAHWKFTTQVAYVKYNQRGYSNWPAYPAGIKQDGTLYRNIGIWDAASEAKLGQVFLTGDATTGSLSHHILAGLDMGFKNYMADWNQSAPLQGYGYDQDGNYVPVDFNIYHPLHGNVPAQGLPSFDRSKPLRTRAGGNIIGESYSSVYVQDELRVLQDRVRVTLAGRYTSIKQNAYGATSDDGHFTPRVGVSISLAKETSLYGLYDQAFVPQQGVDNSKNKPLVPVTGNNIEGGLKRDWAGGRWNSTVSIYQITRNNVVSYRPGQATYATQTGQTKTNGVELDVRGEIAPGLNLTINYAYTHAEITKDEDPEKVGGIVPGSGFATHISNAWLSYRVQHGKLKGVGASLGYQWQGNRNTWDWGADTEAAKKLPPYTRVDGGLSWRGTQMSVTLNVNNIFDTYLFSGAPYELDNNPMTTEYYYQIEPGRNYRLTIGYSF